MCRICSSTTTPSGCNAYGSLGLQTLRPCSIPKVFSVRFDMGYPTSTGTCRRALPHQLMQQQHRQTSAASCLRADDHGGLASTGMRSINQRSAHSGSSTAASASVDEVNVVGSSHSLGDSPGAAKKWGGQNKGRRLSEETKAKISAAKKVQWKDKAYKARVTAAVRQSLQGKPAWNRGLKMSDECRGKVSEARLGTTHSKTTRAKMSRSHKGLTHTQASKVAMSVDRRGVMLPDAHRLAIAAAQRRRHATNRVLQAVEAVHRGGAEAQPGNPNIDAARFRTLSDVSSSGLRGVPGSVPLTKVQMLSAYRNQLREYRSLQEELTPWTHAFAAKYGRKPTLADVERTGLSWLISKYKCYVMMRDRLLMTTPKLRTSVAAASGDAPSGRSSGDTCPQPRATSKAGSRGTSEARMPAAVYHRRFQAQRAESPLSHQSSAGIVTATGGVHSRPIADSPPGSSLTSADDMLAAATAAAEASGKLEAAALRGSVVHTTSQPHMQEDADLASLQRASRLQTASTAAEVARGRPNNSNSSGGGKASGRSLPVAPSNAPRRVRSAMAAALAYRQKQASDTAASASAAAAAAAVPPSSKRNRMAAGDE